MEMKNAFTDYSVGSYTGITREKLRYEKHAYEALLSGDLSALENTLKRLFAGIPWQNLRNNRIAEYEDVDCRMRPSDKGGLLCHQ